MIYSSTITSPLGKLYLYQENESLCALSYHKEDHWEEQSHPKLTPLFRETQKQLTAYWASKKNENFDLPLKFYGTDFQKKVWKTLQKIPFGTTWSYKQLAKKVGRPLASRAVGNANGKNPFSIIVPCHRVIAHSGALGGYTGGLPKKKFLLGLES